MPYVVWMDGIGWRNDKVKEDVAGMDVPWDIFWHAQAYRGKVGILDDRRDALSMPMQRDAMQKGTSGPTSTPRTPTSSRRRRAISPSSAASATRRSRSPTTRRCPRARPCCTTRGRETCSRPRSTTCRRASRPTCCRTGGRRRTGSSRTTSSAIGRTAKQPVLAHQFVNFMLDEKNAYDNFVNFTGYTPPQKGIDADDPARAGPDPEDPPGGDRAARTSSRRTRSCSS